MKRSLAAGGILLGLAARTRADTVGYQLEASVASNYVYRGIVQYSSRSAPSSQNTVAIVVDGVASGTVTVTAWNATALADYGDQPGNALEFDLSAAYATHRGAFGITAGYMAYLYPSHMAGTPVDGAHELFGVVTRDHPWITPMVGAYFEFARQQGVYLAIGGSHDIKAGALTISPSVSVGGASYRKYLGGDQRAAPHINDVTVAAAGKYEFARGVYATLKVSYALRGTPSDLAPMMDSWGFTGRSSLFGVLAVGVAR